MLLPLLMQLGMIGGTPAGAGYPTGIYWGVRKIKKTKRLDDILKQAMEQIVQGELEVEPITAKAVNVIKPFIEVKDQSIEIDWVTVEKDIQTVKTLLKLWQEQMDAIDEEDILLLSE